MLKKWVFLLSLIPLFLSACSGGLVNYSSNRPVDLCSRMAVIPFSNHTETPLAGERAMSIAAALLESRGIYHLAVYQNQFQGKMLFPGMNQVVSQKTLLIWARSTEARYALTGSVNEWSYKVGLDGEPVVGLSLQLINLRTEDIVWTAVGSLSGGSRTAVSTVAQELLNSMLDGLLSTRHDLCPQI